MLIAKSLTVGVARRRHRFEFWKLNQARNTGFSLVLDIGDGQE
ncbi:hypothetical protein WKK05_05150 [Nostoc sp. UHCC 0302]